VCRARPLPGAELVGVGLGGGLLVGAAAGAALGLAAFVLLEAELAVPAWPLLAAALCGPAAFGVVAAGPGWASRPRSPPGWCCSPARWCWRRLWPPGSAVPQRSGSTRGRGRGVARP